MNPQRKTALVSVGAAGALVVLKLTVGLSAGQPRAGVGGRSLRDGSRRGAAHLLRSGRRGAAGRRLASLRPREGGASRRARRGGVPRGGERPDRRAGRSSASSARGPPTCRRSWYVFATIAIVIVVDASRDRDVAADVAGAPAAPRWRRTRSTSRATWPGRSRCSFGLLLVRAGHPNGDALAALFVAVLVLVAAARLMRRNVDVLMDRAPADAEEAARVAIAALGPRVELRRLRMRQAAGRQFADVVIGVSPTSPVGEGHAVADAVEAGGPARAAGQRRRRARGARPTGPTRASAPMPRRRRSRACARSTT